MARYRVSLRVLLLLVTLLGEMSTEQVMRALTIVETALAGGMDEDLHVNLE